VVEIWLTLTEAFGATSLRYGVRIVFRMVDKSSGFFALGFRRGFGRVRVRKRFFETVQIKHEIHWLREGRFVAKVFNMDTIFSFGQNIVKGRCGINRN
jgi:hypothetical protein